MKGNENMIELNVLIIMNKKRVRAPPGVRHEETVVDRGEGGYKTVKKL